MPYLESVLMKPRNDNPALYRENVYKSWKIIARVVANVDDECLIAHLEPNQGVGYDCLSLITKDESGRLRTRFMLNRNGVNSNVLDRVWDRFDQVGCDQVAEEIVEASGLQLSQSTVSSSASIFCNEVVAWIENHRTEEFCVGPIGWPGGCQSFLDVQRETPAESAWLIPDHGPELCLGIGGVECVRLYQNIHTPLSFPVKVGSKLDRASEIRSLATAIACCDEIDRACVDRKHPCHKIVTTQKEFGEEYRQVPEAWAGNLEHARVIFVSSNPSISIPRVHGTGEMYPLAGYFDSRIKHPDWPIERVTDFQVNRLDQSRKNPFVTYNAQFLCTDGQYRGSDSENGTKASQKYWKSAIKQAQDLLGPAFDLSRDICMTEIVHCKSKGEQGVSKSSGTCSEKYLAKTLQLSGSLLVLVGGAKARAQVHKHRQEWQDDGLATWDISDGFGFFRNGENHPSDHVGLIRIQDDTKIVVATEQLSYASNVNRFVQSVIGEQAFNKLAMHLRSDSPAIFGSRLEVLDFLRI